MPKVTEEFLLEKREEIIDACAQLYETMSFKDITLKEIANATSLNRTSIYNYFDTKEEIFLAYMQKEYELWIEDLENLCRNNKELSRDELADKLVTVCSHQVEENVGDNRDLQRTVLVSHESQEEAQN